MILEKPFYGAPIWIENIDQADPYPWITLMGSDVDYFPTAQTATFSEGTITYGVAYSPTAQTATFTEGTITSGPGYAVTAQTSTFSEGTVLPEADYFPTQQTGTFAEGTITATGGDVGPPVSPPSQAGGTGSSRKKIKRAREVFEEEMAKLERQATEATEQREQIEEKLSTSSPYEPVPQDWVKWIADFEQALRRAQAREKRQQLPGVPVYFRIPEKSDGVKRIEAHQRLEMLAKVARHREQVATERLRKVRDRIDLEAATAFMNFILWDD